MGYVTGHLHETTQDSLFVLKKKHIHLFFHRPKRDKRVMWQRSVGKFFSTVHTSTFCDSSRSDHTALHLHQRGSYQQSTQAAPERDRGYLLYRDGASFSEKVSVEAAPVRRSEKAVRKLVPLSLWPRRLVRF